MIGTRPHRLRPALPGLEAEPEALLPVGRGLAGAARDTELQPPAGEQIGGPLTGAEPVDRDAVVLADAISTSTDEQLRDTIVATIWDGVDPVPTVGEALGVVRNEFPIASAGREARLRDALRDVAGGYDLVPIDCPPSLDPLTINALTPADRVWRLSCLLRVLEGVVDPDAEEAADPEGEFEGGRVLPCSIAIRVCRVTSTRRARSAWVTPASSRSARRRLVTRVGRELTASPVGTGPRG